MMYAELAYFDGDHCQHLADFHERNRLERIQRDTEAAMRRVNRNERPVARGEGA